MKCKYCRREIEKNSMFCNWCGQQQIEVLGVLSVPKPQRLKNGTFAGRVMVNGNREYVTGNTEEEYYQKARAVKAGLMGGDRTDNITVASCLEEYITDRSNIVSPSTYRSYRHIQENHFTELQKRSVSTLTIPVIQSAINREAAEYQAKTVRNAWGLISAAIRYHTDLDLTRVKLPTRKPSSAPVYGDEEIIKLLQAVKGDPVELAVYLAACLGLRRSEILALSGDSFDRKNHTVTISQARVPDFTNHLVVKGTKTAKSNRVISCPDFIFDLVPECGAELIYGKYQQNYLLARLQRICEREGLPQITLHGLRHSNASLMLRFMPDKYAMARGGWSSSKTMKDIYQHTLDAEQIKYDKKLEDHLQWLIDQANLPTEPGKH